MKRCCDCGCIFEQPITYTEDCTPGGVFEGGAFINKYDGCPSCGGAFDYVEQCDRCGEWQPTELCGSDCIVVGFICEKCLDEVLEVTLDE